MANNSTAGNSPGSLTGRLRDVLIAISCFTAGLCGSLAFDPGRWGIWATPILAMSVVLAATFDASPRKAALLWFLFATGHFGLGLSWTHASLHVFGGVPLAVAIVISTSLGLLLALFYAAAAWTGRKIAGEANMGWSLACIVATWTLFEHARGWVFSGFGWLSIGYSQVPRSAIAGYIPTFGSFGASAICAIIAALLVVALLQRSYLKSAAPLSAVALIMAGGWGLRQISHTQKAGEPFVASILQGAVPQDSQWLSSNFRSLPARYLGMAHQATGRLLVTPESSFPFEWEDYENTGGKSLQDYLDMLGERQGHIIIGAFTKSPESVRFRNSAVILGADGKTQTYSKRHLTPYGEYLPFSSLLEPILTRAKIPFSDLEPGTSDGIVELPYAKLGVSICYESLFPRLFHSPPAEVLVNMTNDSWFDGTAMPRQHLQIAMARALENERWLIRASNTGPSAIIRPDGRIADYLTPLIRGTATSEVVPLSGSTPYSRFGEYPVLLASLSVLLAYWLRRQRK